MKNTWETLILRYTCLFSSRGQRNGSNKRHGRLLQIEPKFVISRQNLALLTWDTGLKVWSLSMGDSSYGLNFDLGKNNKMYYHS